MKVCFDGLPRSHWYWYAIFIASSITSEPPDRNCAFASPFDAATSRSASSSAAGNLSYTPALGTVLAAGPQTLSVTFAPTDTTDYTTATQTVLLTVNKAPLSVTANNLSMSYGGTVPVLTGTLTGVIGGVRCVLERFERKFLQVTGTPDPSVFRVEDHKKSMHFGRLDCPTLASG